VICREENFPEQEKIEVMILKGLKGK